MNVKDKDKNRELLEQAIVSNGVRHLIAAIGFHPIQNGFPIVKVPSEQEMNVSRDTSSLVTLSLEEMVEAYDHDTGLIRALSSHQVESEVNRVSQKPEDTRHNRWPVKMMFGGGICFPEDFVDYEGEVEPWVGVPRSVKQADRMMEVFLRENSCIPSCARNGNVDSSK